VTAARTAGRDGAPGPALYEALLRPRSVAIVGASGTPGKTTARPLEYLLASGWGGRLHPVNPARPTVLGQRSYARVRDLPEVPDHVFVVTTAEPALDALEECAQIGVPVVTLMADGFTESDPAGRDRVRRLRQAVESSATRVLGPSSLGVVNLADGFLLTANAALVEPDLPAGDVFVASQSGSAIGALLSRGKSMGIGFRALVSTGGELDLSLGELCLASLEDPGVASYALFLENLSGVDDLREFAHAAAERGKPVVAYKLGRSAAAADLAVSHTGALAGDDTVASALLQSLGIARVSHFEALLEAQHLARATALADRPLRQPRVAVVSTTGGGGAMMVDCLATYGAVPTPPSAETLLRLAEHGIDAGPGALVDLTLAGARYEVMKAALDVLTTAPEFDAVVAVPGSSARFHPDLAVKPIADSAGTARPLAAFVMPEAPEALALLRRSGVAAFATPESCADPIVAVFGRRRPTGTPAVHPDPGGRSRVLDEDESYRLLASVGVAHAPYAVVSTAMPSPEMPVAVPAAVKILSPDAPHKSDIGGVVLGVRDRDGLAAAISSIVAQVSTSAPHVGLDRVLVQEMVEGVGEVLVGFRHDELAGPVVVLAAGGVLAELHHDRSVRTAPVDLATAQDMIDDVVSLKAVQGYRGLPRGDVAALAEVIVAVSRVGVVTDGAVVEAEANPVIVLPEGRGAVAVDALVRVVEREEA
jgi:acyl-CoA synthetase (NDP forming)